MNRRIDDLTCCRALFAAWVFTYHLDLQIFSAELFGSITPFIHRGYLGVDGFFILSGFVLAHVHADMGLSWRELGDFWRRRLARIYPVHFTTIVLLAMLLLGGWLWGLTPRDPARFGRWALLENLLLMQGWGPVKPGTWNYPSWTISTEWAGYLAFPLLWFALRRLPVAWLYAVLAAALAVLFWVEYLGGIMRLNLANSSGFGRFVPEFTAGMALAGLLPRWQARYPTVALPIVGLAIVLAGSFGGLDTFLVLGMFAILAGLAALAGQGRPPLLARIPGFVFLGTISYSFYLSFAVIEMIQAVLWRQLAIVPADHAGAFALTTVAATFALAWALFRLVERPGQRLAALAARRAGG
jgi:peptidoglycan/LPS O-acetylase OafA/YrhL